MAGPLLTRSILFTDIVESTATFGAIGERAATRLRERHFRLLKGQVDRHGGRTVKTLGDGLMAVFESASDAIDCGIDLQRMVSADAAGVGGVDIAIRIGISTGDVRVSDDGDCHGQAVIEASRLCSHAGGGDVLLSEGTRLMARSLDRLHEVGQLALKGLRETTLAWRADWVSDQPRPLRVVLADDAVLVRQGVAQVLEADGIEVLAQVENADDLLRAVADLHPDVVVVDIRMPPTFTVEGIDAALAIRANHPGTGVLVLSQDAHAGHARRLEETGPSGVGLMLKEHVVDLAEFTRAVRAVADGDVVMSDPALS